MKNEKDFEKRADGDWLSKYLGSILGAIVVTAFIIGLTAIVLFQRGVEKIGNSPGEWGTVGDFFGGTLNPVFSFLTIIALVLTLLLQNRELKASRAELELTRKELEKSSEALSNQNRAIEQQSFEQTFFAWLGTYREILGEVRAESASGRGALKALWADSLAGRTVDSFLSRSVGLSPEAYPLVAACSSVGKRTIAAALEDGGGAFVVSAGAMREWELLYRREENQLDSLFRVLYRLLRWIDSHRDERLSPEQKWLYVSIVRSQLSWIEMVYLFYNGHTFSGRKFKPLIEKYALFDNLNFQSDQVIALLRACPPDTEGYSTTAYSSDSAREALGLRDPS